MPISEVFASARGTSALRSKMKDWRLWERWEEMAGAAVAAHARPARWVGKKLVIRVDQASWMQELSFLKAQITERIQREFPASGIRDIKLEQGELPPPPKRMASQKTPKALPLCGDDREFIERAIERIGDEELRDQARRAMTRGFERIKSRG